MARGGIGERVRAYRRRRGLSQAALAGLVGRSKSWLSQVERGVRSVDRLSVVAEMARVLNVDVQDLTGRPWQYAPNGGVDVESLSEVRRTFTRYEHLRATQHPRQSPWTPCAERCTTAMLTTKRHGTAASWSNCQASSQRRSGYGVKE